MLPIYICEDNQIELDIIKGHVQEFVDFNFDEIAPDIYAFKNPFDLLDYLKLNVKTGIYLLDYKLNCDINGIQLAAEIRKYDPMGFIIFITTYSECAPLLFKYQVEALTYISKDMPYLNQRIYKALSCAYKRYNAYINSPGSKPHVNLKIEVNGQYYNFNYNDILYVCSSPTMQHKIEIHSGNRIASFYYSINKIESILPKDIFFRCSRSCIVNLNHLSHYDKKKRILYLNNGSEISIPKGKVRDLLYNTKYLQDL